MDDNQKKIIASAQKLLMPQPGGQTMFLASPAKFTIYGGAAGAGKTYGMALATLRGYNTPGFAAATFRRHLKEHKQAGGTIDTARDIFQPLGAEFKIAESKWVFKSGAIETYEGLESENDVYSHQGDQIPLLKFDELTHFTEKQFRYLFTRNRPGPGLPVNYPCQILASCNPDPDSWVKKFVEWYLKEDGTPDHFKRGVIRYFASKGDEFYFGGNPQILAKAFGFDAETDCHSYTFIYGSLADNKYRNTADYIASLKMAGDAETQALLYGNWNVKRAGKMFKRTDFELFTTPPPYYEAKIMVVDTAHKIKQIHDYSVMQVWGLYQNKAYLIDQFRDKVEFDMLVTMFVAMATKHPDLSKIYIEDKSAGTPLIQVCRKDVKTPIHAVQRGIDKYTRAWASKPFISGGYIYLNPLADYFVEFTNEMVAFDASMKHDHDDQADCVFDMIDIFFSNPREEFASRERSQTGVTKTLKPKYI